MSCVITEKCLLSKIIIIIIIKTKPKKIEKFMGCPPSPFWLMRVANHPHFGHWGTTPKVLGSSLATSKPALRVAHVQNWVASHLFGQNEVPVGQNEVPGHPMIFFILILFFKKKNLGHVAFLYGDPKFF
jgi:hypothetical protein